MLVSYPHGDVCIQQHRTSTLRQLRITGLGYASLENGVKWVRRQSSVVSASGFMDSIDFDYSDPSQKPEHRKQ
jgi:hypothetical protein